MRKLKKNNFIEKYSTTVIIDRVVPNLSQCKMTTRKKGIFLSLSLSVSLSLSLSFHLSMVNRVKAKEQSYSQDGIRGTDKIYTKFMFYIYKKKKNDLIETNGDPD